MRKEMQLIKSEIYQSQQLRAVNDFVFFNLPQALIISLCHIIFKLISQSVGNKNGQREKATKSERDILNKEAGWMWVGIDCNDKELRVCAATVYMKAGQRDDDTEGCDNATPTVAKSKSPPVTHSPALVTTRDSKSKTQEHHQSGALHVGFFWLSFKDLQPEHVISD